MPTMKCPQCGGDVNTAGFCNRCGWNPYPKHASWSHPQTIDATIDALKAESERLKDKQENWIDRADDMLSDLRDENKRLREAIEQIVHHPAYDGGDALSMVRIAQKALESEE